MSQQIEMSTYAGDPPIVYILPADELIPAVATFCVGLMFNHIVIGALIAFWVVRRIRRVKEGRPDGFLLHSVMRFGFFHNGKVRTLPNPFITEYIV